MKFSITGRYNNLSQSLINVIITLKTAFSDEEQLFAPPTQNWTKIFFHPRGSKWWGLTPFWRPFLKKPVRGSWFLIFGVFSTFFNLKLKMAITSQPFELQRCSCAQTPSFLMLNNVVYCIWPHLVWFGLPWNHLGPPKYGCPENTYRWIFFKFWQGGSPSILHPPEWYSDGMGMYMSTRADFPKLLKMAKTGLKIHFKGSKPPEMKSAPQNTPI